MCDIRMLLMWRSVHRILPSTMGMVFLVVSGCGGGGSGDAGSSVSADTETTGGMSMVTSDAAMPGAMSSPGSSGHGAPGHGSAPSAAPPMGDSSGAMDPSMNAGAAVGMSSMGHGASPSGAMAGFPGQDGIQAGAGMAGFPGSLQQPPPQPARPADFRSWQDHDFVAAVRERDPRVLDAIDERVKSAPGDPAVVTLLTSLLVTMAEQPAAPVNQAAGGYTGAAGGYPGAAPYPGSMETPGAVSSAGSSAADMHGAPGTGAVPGGAGTPGAPAATSPAGHSAGPAPATRGQIPAQGAIRKSGIPDSVEIAREESNPDSMRRVSELDDSLRQLRDAERAVDTLAMMIVESSTSYQNPAAGAIATRGVPGALGAAAHDAGTDVNAAAGVPAGGDMLGGNSGGLLSGPSSGAYPGMNAAGAGAGYGGAGYPGATGPGGGGSLDPGKLIDKIVDGLIQNGSPQAWQTLYGIAAHSVGTPLGAERSSEIIIRGLYRNIHHNPAMIEPVLLSVIDGSANVPASTRLFALRFTAEVAGAALDKVTGFDPPVAGPAPGGAMAGYGVPGMDMTGMGAAPGTMGVGALTSGATTPGAMTSGAMTPGAMTSGTSGAVGFAGAMAPAGYPGASGAVDAGYSGQVPGGYGAPAPATPPEPPAGPGGLSKVAMTQAEKFLWGTSFISALVTQLDSSSDLNTGGNDSVGGGDLLLVAASIPDPAVRRAVASLFQRTHASGPASLAATGFFRGGVHDPGMLPVMKSLPRQKAPRSSAAATPPDAWTTATEELTVSLRDRLRGLSAKSGKMTSTGDNFPIKLHKNGIAEFAGMMTLTSAGEANPGNMVQVYYARSSFMPQRARDQEELMSHYESRAGGVRRLNPQRGIVWIDGVKTGTTGRRRTIDVVIQSSGSSGGFGGSQDGFSGGPGGVSGAGGGAGGSYSVEIIVVDAVDPLGVTGGDALSNAGVGK